VLEVCQLERLTENHDMAKQEPSKVEAVDTQKAKPPRLGGYGGFFASAS
jgi:hypothetical protein